VNPLAEFTVPEKILLAAHQLEEMGQAPFSAETLIVAAWQKYPQTFGLKGYAEQYPDSNKVLASIMGEKGLAKRGWLVKVGQKLYDLTREGRQVVRRLRQDGEPPAAAGGASSTESVRVSKEQERLLQSLFNSSALQKIQEGRKPELTFADACRFWGITENMHGDALDARLDHLRASLATLERQFGTSGGTLSDGRSVSSEEISGLAEIHDYLEERFSRHLTLLRTRSGRV
jgi:hypothetical protein